VQKLGNLTIGLGVKVTGIVQSINQFAEERLRDAGGDRASAEAQEAAYRDLEGILDSLGQSNVSTKLTSFFTAIQNINNAPENVPVKKLAIDAGRELARTIQTLQQRIGVKHDDLNTRVVQVADEINTLSEEIRALNLRIVQIEGGGASGSDAGGLRSQRGLALSKLTEIADVEAIETETGVVNISLNGRFLVFEGTRNAVLSVNSDDAGAVDQRIVFASDNSELVVGGGELGGVYAARDNIMGSFLSSLDEFAGALAFEFNKAYSQGQGEVGYTSLTGTYRADDPLAALDQAGLDFSPVNGEFNVLIHNKNIEGSAGTETTTIDIDLLGDNGNPTTLTSLAAQLNAVDGITASVSLDNQLVIKSDSPDIEFGFEKDTSGALAALGINTFFTGADARNLGVNKEVLADGAKFASSLLGISSVDNDNAIQLSELQDRLLSAQGGRSIGGIYQQLVDGTTQGATTTASIADGLRTFEGTLQADAQAVSGVNLDEEAIDMIQLQRAYQASARYIRTISELLDVLVNL
jgi:flagellar hook-associated protein 1 FlgK